MLPDPTAVVGGGSVRYQRRVGWSDVDCAGIWTFVAALRYVEEAEVELLRRVGVLGEVYPHLPRAHVEATYVRPVGFDAIVMVELDVARVGTSSIQYQFRILTDNGEIAAKGSLRVVYVGGNGRPSKLPVAVREALAVT